MMGEDISPLGDGSDRFVDLESSEFLDWNGSDNGAEGQLYLKECDSGIKHIGRAKRIHYFWESPITGEVVDSMYRPSQCLYKEGTLFMLLLTEDTVCKIELV